MKFTQSASALKSILSQALRLGTGDATHPGFGLLHAQVTDKGALRVSVVNAQACVRLVQEVDNDEAGEMAISLQNATDLANSLTSQGDVSISLVDRGPGQSQQVRLKAGGLTLKFPSLAVQDVIPFPKPPDGVKEKWQTLDGALLARIAKQVLWACAPVTEPRVQFQGVHVTNDYCEAADGHRLARMDCKLASAPADTIIPAAAIQVASGLLGDGTGKIAIHEGRVWLQGPSFLFTCRLITAQYPITDKLWMNVDAGQLLDNEFKPTRGWMLRVHQDGLRAAAALLSQVHTGDRNDGKPVLRWLLKPDTLHVIARDEIGNGVDVAQLVPFTGKYDEDGAAALNSTALDAGYMHKIVSVIPESDDGFLQMVWIGPKDRVQLSNGDMRVVVMPRT